MPDTLSRPLFTLGSLPVSLMTLLQVVLVLALSWLGSRAVRLVLRRWVLARTHLDHGAREAVARIAGYMVMLVALLAGLSTVGIDLTSLSVLIGALGVGIGFGLQNIVGNFVSGLIILVERPIQVGQRLDVGGTAGRVTRIGARSTTIVSNDNIAWILPNSTFIEQPVINWSLGGDRKVRFKLPVGVAYGSSPREVERLLLEVAAADPAVLAEPAPRVVFKGFGESALDFELRVWSESLSDRPAVLRSGLYFAIWDAFRAAGVEIPFPQRDLHLKGPVTLHGAPG